MFTPYHIDPRKVGAFAPIVMDYLSGKLRADGNAPWDPDPKSIEAALKKREGQMPDRQVLGKALFDQYQRDIGGLKDDADRSVRENIEALENEGVYTVTTGHQLSLFTGPLYFIYKIVSTINLAERLNEEFQGCNFIPVFWMASEDHDREEVATVQVFGDPIYWSDDQLGPVGRMRTNRIPEAVEALKGRFSDDAREQWLIGLIEEAYQGHETVGAATRYLVHRLFRDRGLLILDGDDRQLKREFVPEMREELRNGSLGKGVEESARTLGGKYELQATPREINLFYIENGLRERMVKDEKGWRVLGTNLSFDEAGIERLMDENPECLSPNVVARPLYQEKVLPNVAYVGGGAEVAYWMELPKAFEHFGIPFPVPLLRDSAILIDRNTVKRVRKAGFGWEDLFRDTDALIRETVKEELSENFQFTEERQKLENTFRSLGEKAEAVDPSLKDSVEAEKQKSLKSLERIEKKMVRAGKKKHQNGVDRIRAIKGRLFPNGRMQERVESFLTFYPRYGDAFFEALYEHFDPLEKTVLILADELEE